MILTLLVIVNDILFFKDATMTIINKAKGILSKRTNN